MKWKDHSFPVPYGILELCFICKTVLSAAEHFELLPDLLCPTSGEVYAPWSGLSSGTVAQGSMLRRACAWCKALFLPS